MLYMIMHGMGFSMWLATLFHSRTAVLCEVSLNLKRILYLSVTIFVWKHSMMLFLNLKGCRYLQTWTVLQMTYKNVVNLYFVCFSLSLSWSLCLSLCLSLSFWIIIMQCCSKLIPVLALGDLCFPLQVWMIHDHMSAWKTL